MTLLRLKWVLVAALSLMPALALAGPPGQLIGIGGRCLGVLNGRAEPYSPVGTLDCTGGPEQTWQAQPDGTVVGLGGLCLDVRQVNRADGTPLGLYPCHGGANQRWEMQRGLLVGLANKCMDVEGAVQRPGTRVILWPCHGKANQQWQLANWAPPQAPRVQTQVVVASTDVDAGPIWNQEDAQRKCPQVCQPGSWTGQWRTLVAGQRSVCGCVPPQEGPRAGHGHEHERDHDRDRPQAASPAPMDEAAFAAFLGRLRDAAFTEPQLQAVADQVKVGSLFTCRQVIAVMQVVNFPDAQVSAATTMWPAVLDRANAPEVIASLTFESHRRQLRANIGL